MRNRIIELISETNNMKTQNITQRRNGSNVGSASSATLPMTNQDTGSPGRKHHRRKLGGLSFSPYDRTSLIRWLLLILFSMFFAAFIRKPVLSILGIKTHAIQHDEEARTSRHGRRHLSQYSELSFALQNSDLLAIYFAASWCPMSTPISHALDEAFGNKDILLTAEGGSRSTLSIVYVSSDETKEEYDEYLNHGRDWIAVPFESPQISQLKRHFSTCARRELGDLGIDRKHEIPTIIVIDSQTQGIITTSGADDVDEMGYDALNHWQDLQKRIRKVSSEVA